MSSELSYSKQGGIILSELKGVIRKINKVNLDVIGVYCETLSICYVIHPMITMSFN